MAVGVPNSTVLADGGEKSPVRASGKNGPRYGYTSDRINDDYLEQLEDGRRALEAIFGPEFVDKYILNEPNVGIAVHVLPDPRIVPDPQQDIAQGIRADTLTLVGGKDWADSGVHSHACGPEYRPDRVFLCFTVGSSEGYRIDNGNGGTDWKLRYDTDELDGAVRSALSKYRDTGVEILEESAGCYSPPGRIAFRLRLENEAVFEKLCCGKLLPI
jgi:hypothetical protein